MIYPIPKNHTQMLVSSFVVLLLLGVLGRLLPHFPGSTPVMAIALFAGFAFRSKIMAISLIAMIMSISDAFLGFYSLGLMLVVNLALMAPIILGRYLQVKFSCLSLACYGLGSGLGFFIISNFAVWGLENYYPMTLSGLVACYIAGLPFLKGMLFGNLLWSGVLFFAYQQSQAYLNWETKTQHNAI